MQHYMTFLIALTAVSAVSATAHADFVPTHGAAVHQDPFIAGWLLPPAAVPGPGIVLPGPQYDLLGPGAFDALPGADGLVSPDIWHWEFEIDFDPNPADPALPPVINVTFDATAVGGGVFGPIPVPIIAGPEFRVDFHQADAGALGETGGFLKSFLNGTPRVMAWGTSVVEDVGILGQKFIDILGDGRAPFEQSVPATALPDAIEMIQRGPEDFTVFHIPEPATLSLLVLGGLLMARRRKDKGSG